MSRLKILACLMAFEKGNFFLAIAKIKKGLFLVYRYIYKSSGSS